MQSLFSCPVRPPVIGAAGHHVKPLPYKRDNRQQTMKGVRVCYTKCAGVGS